MRRVDVAVVGAGMAGLTAARALLRQGLDVAVVEARARIGGRVLTRHAPGVAVPIELGPEFVHGDAPHTMRLLAEAGLSACDVAGDHVSAVHGRVRRVEFWKMIDSMLRRIPADGPDQSFAEFLRRHRGGTPRERRAAAEFVQGFDAADLARVSAQSLVPGDAPPSASAARIARVTQGYAALVAHVAHGMRGHIRTRAVVTDIAWSPGQVTLGMAGPGRARELTARAVVVTVPLGVLLAEPGAPGAIRWSPRPPVLAATARGLAMGAVARLVLQFRELPWQGLDPAPHDTARWGFVHVAGAPFPTWWTTHPVRSPVLVAWCAGPPAVERLRGGKAAMVSAALDTLAQAFAVSARRVRARLAYAWVHDWHADPFTRGAYSYTLVGGGDAAAALARPVSHTIFFAGEASDAVHSGTVEGAIASGEGAARQVVRALGRRPKPRRRA